MTLFDIERGSLPDARAPVNGERNALKDGRPASPDAWMAIEVAHVAHFFVAVK